MAHGLDRRRDRLCADPPRPGRQPRSQPSAPTALPRPIWEAPATRRSTQRCWETTASSPSAVRTSAACRRPTSGLCGYTARRDAEPELRQRRDRHHPVRRERALRPTPSRCSQTARSSSPESPSPPTASTRTSRSRATTPTAASTTTSVPTGSPPSTWAPKTTTPRGWRSSQTARSCSAGNAGEDVGLVRLLPNGSLDTTFGNLGKSVTKIGLGADVNGVALDSDGGILIAGSTVGAISQNRDFLLAGFRGDGNAQHGLRPLRIRHNRFRRGRGLRREPAGGRPG